MPNSKKIAVASEGILLFDSLIGMGLAAHVLRLAAWTTAPPRSPQQSTGRRQSIRPFLERARRHKCQERSRRGL
jgi:hypothetical protein